MSLDFITTEMFVSFLGCLTIVSIITEAVKHMPKMDKINPLWITLISSIFVSILRVVILNSYTLQDILLGVLNTFAIYLGAIGGYETVKHVFKKEEK